MLETEAYTRVFAEAWVVRCAVFVEVPRDAPNPMIAL